MEPGLDTLSDPKAHAFNNRAIVPLVTRAELGKHGPISKFSNRNCVYMWGQSSNAFRSGNINEERGLGKRY